MSNVDKNAEIILVNPTANSGTINLPLTSTLPYRTLTIKHIGSTSLNGITVATQGPDTFEDGTTSYVITRITTFATFYANASANKWVLVGGTNTFTQTISSLTVNTINGQSYLPISPANLVSTSLLDTTFQSTVRGLATIGYISTSQLVSTTIGLVDHLELQSTFVGLGTVGYISSSQLASSLQSTVRGLGTIGYISSATSGATPAFLSTSAFFTSSLVASTISTTNTIFTNALIARSTNISSAVISSLIGTTISTQQLLTNGLIARSTNISSAVISSLIGTTISTQQLITNSLVARSTNLSSVYISSLTAVTGYISSLTTDSITIGDGNGWVDFGAARAVVFSSIQENTGSLYATTAFIGNTSTLNQIRYWGLFGNYNNTILAEMSTGTAVGAQEFLLFKGSSASDRIRFQTTGDIRFEPQVAAREFSTATALATPTMILQSNLVGIATVSPVATLDVRGTAFVTTMSSQQHFLSSLNGIAFSNFISTASLVSTTFGLVDHLELQSSITGLATIGYISSSQLTSAFTSTLTGLSNVAVTQIVAGTNVTISPVGGQGIVTINASGGGGGGITAGNLVSTVEGLGTVNYISGPDIVVSTVFGAQIAGGSILTASTLYIANDFLASEFPVWNSSNQILGSDPDPAPLAMDVFGSARILKNLYVGSTTTVLTTAGVQAQQLSSLHTTASTITLSDKRPLFASTNTVTSITDVFLNDSYVAQRIPIMPIVISSITTNMQLQPEFLGMHFVLTNSDSNFGPPLLVRGDATFVANVPDGWYCYLKQTPDSNYPFNSIEAETDLSNAFVPTTDAGMSNYQAPMKFIVSGGLKIPY